jgi:chlorosome envelope protein X
VVKIKFQPISIEVDTPTGSEILEVYQKNPTLPLRFGCKKGHCGTCFIKVLEGQKNLTKMSPDEQALLSRMKLGENYRLACQCAINGPITIEKTIPEIS